MSYFGKYNGRYTGSWWGGIIAFLKGKATSFNQILNTALSNIGLAFQSAASDSIAVTAARTTITTSVSTIKVALSSAASKISATTSGNAIISTSETQMAASGGTSLSKQANDATSALKSTSANSDDKKLAQGESSDV